MLVEFSLKLLYSTMCGKNFQIYGVIKKNARKILENALIRGIFTHAPPHSKLAPPNSCHHALGRRKLLIPPGSILSQTCFPQQQKGVEETMICFIKIQSENMKMTWNITLFIFCMICNFFKCDGFPVL